jgi:thiamine-phosphate pyrophosphorylase
MTDSVPPCRLYLISPPDIGGDKLTAFAEQLTAALDAGDVACFQLRLKEDDDIVRRATDLLRPIAQDRNVAFIMNDRPDLARETGCDGVHVGQTDTPYREARTIMGNDPIIGVTCHDSIHLAMEAADAGADYIAFGAFFGSTTKPPKHISELDLLSRWQEMMVVPCVAIGGVTVDNCQPLVAAGADFISVTAGVWGHLEGPAAAVRSFNRVFAETPVGSAPVLPAALPTDID